MAAGEPGQPESEVPGNRPGDPSAAAEGSSPAAEQGSPPKDQPAAGEGASEAGKRLDWWKDLILPLLLAVVAMAATAVGITAVRSDYFIDDAGFYFRFADHLSRGYGFVMNIGDAPTWGVESPIWAILLGAAARLGIAIPTAAVGLGYVCTMTAVALLTYGMYRMVGVTAAIAVILFSATHYSFLLFAVQGVETPLTYLLLSLGLLWVMTSDSQPAVGLVAGLAAVYNLFLIPFAFLLLIAAGVKKKGIPFVATLIALGICAAGYGLAWWYFGHYWPEPLQSYIDQVQTLQWYIDLSKENHSWLLLALLAFILGWWHITRGSILLMMFGGYFLVIMLSSQRLTPPTWNYNHLRWLAAEYVPFIIIMVAGGLVLFLNWFIRWWAEQFGPMHLIVSSLTRIMPPFMIGCLMLTSSLFQDARFKVYLEGLSADHIKAGQWIRNNTPEDARVWTWSANTAYYAHRPIFDLYLLSGKPAEKQPDRSQWDNPPEVMVWKYAKADIKAHQGYRIGQIFDSIQEPEENFFVVVQIKEKFANRTTPSPFTQPGRMMPAPATAPVTAPATQPQ